MTRRSVPATVLASVVVAMTFAAGLVAGLATERLWHRDTQEVRLTNDMAPVLDRLGLSPSVRAQAESILRASAPGTEAIMIEMAARMRDVSDSIDAQLRSILTAAQQGKLDSMRRGPVFILQRQMPSGQVRVDTVVRPVPRN